MLLGLMALASSQIACQQNTAQMLQVAVLKGTLPPQLVATFKAAQSDSFNLNVDTRDNTAELFQWLQQWQTAETLTRRQLPFNFLGRSHPPAIADWVSLSDYWLAAAIKQQLIHPLGVEAIDELSDLPDVWQSQLRRDQQGLLSEQGDLWATPYRWGSLVIVYSRAHFDRISWQPTHWKDIWNPKLAKRISLPNHPRIVIGLVLKSLGQSANAEYPDIWSGFSEALKDLRQQVKVYDSDDYLQPLLQGDTWLAVGWSTDVRPLLSQYRQLNAIVPDPGTLLSADVWVRPRGKASLEDTGTLNALDKAWLRYWWQSDIATPFSLFSGGLSPLLMAQDAVANAADLSLDKVLLPTATQLANSEFLEPLSAGGVEKYTEIWESLRRGK